MISLFDIRPGECAEVLRITSRDPGRLMKLSSLGLVPGSLIRLQQRWPAFLIWVGETQLSVDDEIAREIQLRVDVC